MTEGLHYSVLLKESVEALILNRDGVYVDGTFGRGGHSREILKLLSENGRLIGFDKDPKAIEVAKNLSEKDSRFSYVHGSFADLDKTMRERWPDANLDGVLLDLGVSSPQLDEPERGFSFLKDGPLDMRMNNSQGISAEQWLNSAEESEIAFVLKEYGEEKFARRMAGALVEARENSRISSTSQFAKIVSDANPRWEKGKHPATRAFQAVRIYINSELDDLRLILDASLDHLKLGGRIVVISFHSLEDRIVKRFFKKEAKGKSFPQNIPVTEEMLEKKLKLVGKSIKASDREVSENVRSRSAIMRVAERI